MTIHFLNGKIILTAPDSRMNLKNSRDSHDDVDSLCAMSQHPWCRYRPWSPLGLGHNLDVPIFPRWRRTSSRIFFEMARPHQPTAKPSGALHNAADRLVPFCTCLLFAYNLTASCQNAIAGAGSLCDVGASFMIEWANIAEYHIGFVPISNIQGVRSVLQGSPQHRENEMPMSEVPNPKVLWLNPARRRVFHTFNLKCSTGQQNAKSLLRGLALYMLGVAKFAGVLPNDDLQTVKQKAMPLLTRMSGMFAKTPPTSWVGMTGQRCCGHLLAGGSGLGGKTVRIACKPDVSLAPFFHFVATRRVIRADGSARAGYFCYSSRVRYDSGAQTPVVEVKLVSSLIWRQTEYSMASLLGGSRAGEGSKGKRRRNVTNWNQSTLSLACPEQVNQAVRLLRDPVTETLYCCLLRKTADECFVCSREPSSGHGCSTPLHNTRISRASNTCRDQPLWRLMNTGDQVIRLNGWWHGRPITHKWKISTVREVGNGTIDRGGRATEIIMVSTSFDHFHPGCLTCKSRVKACRVVFGGHLVVTLSDFRGAFQLPISHYYITTSSYIAQEPIPPPALPLLLHPVLLALPSLPNMVALSTLYNTQYLGHSTHYHSLFSPSHSRPATTWRVSLSYGSSIRWQSTNQIESEDRRRVSERHILFFTAGFPSFLADGVHDSWLYSPEAPDSAGVPEWTGVGAFGWRPVAYAGLCVSGLSGVRRISPSPSPYRLAIPPFPLSSTRPQIYLVSVDDAGFGSDLDGSIAQYPHRRLRIYFQEARSTVAQAILA
ncbi:uncharacterized protein BO96DRAFT_436568 [Aspergillus niger CBS 101883]|uniref:Uncharacterized protein n=2 Tax=Aspergillus niger TaxID=5061 RepID=A2R3V8_ASPNC|nr:uncharacterized protein BO96DRAFT_436568 [Aspergillus niger CBS 101883]XP_059602370.1 hypothetical protein An14g05650 [Aspergillus niger]PYH54083.1 hypothetical protein BO96DRAFT_436568 [Aspergillus niger CBS 101883]CAK42126.1 hypothetical protein An14g05650 [Aspergillus niger]